MSALLELEDESGERGIVDPPVGDERDTRAEEYEVEQSARVAKVTMRDELDEIPNGLPA